MKILTITCLVCHLQIAVKDIEHDLDAQTHDCYVAMEVLCEVLVSNDYNMTMFMQIFIYGFLLQIPHDECRSCSHNNHLWSIFQILLCGYQGQFQSQIGKILLASCKRCLTNYQDL